MANLIVTNACNLRCEFCFASEYLAGEADCATERLSLDEVKALMAFSESARFCGGEPTTHPDIVAMVEAALAVPDRDVFMMTNGVWPDAFREFVAGLPYKDARRLSFLVNTLAASSYTNKQRAQLEATFRAVHPASITLGFTVDSADFEYGHILDLAVRLGVRQVRFSVASPNVTDAGSWNLDPERDFPLLASVVHGLFKDAHALGLKVHSDCGYLPPCVFTEEQLADLSGLVGEERLKFSCEGATDIGPGGEVWRCYGLKSVVNTKLDEHEDIHQLEAELQRQTDVVDARDDLYEACAECDFRARGECAGGCYALRTILGVKRRSGAIDDDALYAAVPVVDEARLARSKLTLRLLDDEGVWEPLDLRPSEHRVLEACDGAKTGAEIARALQRAELLRDAGASTGRALRRLLERGVISLRRPQNASDPGNTSVTRPGR